MNALEIIGAFTVVSWTLVFFLCVRLYWLDRLRERQQDARHADVDQLARRAKALSSRSARVERWHDIPTADEIGI